MYFLTNIDPNYNIKGARDPLGFQVIWQAAGRKLIPYLSTVSINIKDFQILCFAFAFKKEFSIADKNFESFFIRFEQLMAYTRICLNNKESFNGIDKVSKLITENPNRVKISNMVSEQILSNQKAYGIWGKYIRPFRDMKMANDPDFENIFNSKINKFRELFNQAARLVKQTDGAYFRTDKFADWFGILEKPTKEERDFFIKKILQDTCENELLKIIDKNKNIIKLPFYEKINTISQSTDNINLKAILANIENTEKVLCPLNVIFRYIQTRSFWTFTDLENDEYISKCKNVATSDEFFGEVASLTKLLKLSNSELVKGLIEYNREVTKRRNSAPWIRETHKGIEVNYFEGSYIYEKFNPYSDSENTYFINSFLSLYSQLN